MSKKKIFWLGLAGVFLLTGLIDAYRYLKPEPEKKQKVLPQNSFPVSSAQELMLVYNAYGGIYPGIADVIHKEFFPKTYPCNLCYLTFGTLGMKQEWQQFLDSMPQKKVELHKDEFMRRYLPEDLQLPIIMVGDGQNVQLLINAAEMNQLKTLPQLMAMVKSKMNS